MKTRIPFSFLPLRILRKISSPFSGIANKISRSFPSLSFYIKQSELALSSQDYIAMSLAASFFFFLVMFTFFSVVFFLSIGGAFALALFISFIVTCFTFSQQLLHPRLVAGRRIKDIERNLLPALQDILVQLNSGIPLFTIMTNISQENYGMLSKEFFHAVTQINAGLPQIDVLDDLAGKNPSP